MAKRDCAGLPQGEGPELWARLSWESDLWIFAYGSLMWDPGFPYCEAVPALLKGYRRSFCVYSRDHRGTDERPGLVLGLDRGGQCKGVAFRVPAVDVPAALGYLWEREMKSRVYRLEALEVELSVGRAEALAFTVDPAHPDYAGGVELGEMARLIHEGVGARGSARDYLAGTMRELTRLGVIDPTLRRLDRAVKAMRPAQHQAA